MQIMNEEIALLRAEADETPHSFSNGFEMKMNQLLREQKHAETSTPPLEAELYKPVRVKILGHALRKSVVAILAAILIIGSALATVAIVRPDVFFAIKEKLTQWVITPHNNEHGELSRNFTPKKPNPPTGYRIIEERLDESGYYLVFENERGNRLNYSQQFAEGFSINVDSEEREIENEVINGKDIVIAEDKDGMLTIVTEDGTYVFIITGYDSSSAVYEMVRNITE